MTNQQIEFHEKLKVAIRPVIAAITPKWPNRLFADEELASYQRFNHTHWHKALATAMLDLLGLDIANISTVYTMAKAAHYSNEPKDKFVASLSSAISRAYVARASHEYKNLAQATYDVSRGSINLGHYARPAYVPTAKVRDIMSHVPKFEVPARKPYMGMQDVTRLMSELADYLCRTTRRSSTEVNVDIQKIITELKPFVERDVYSMDERAKDLRCA